MASRHLKTIELDCAAVDDARYIASIISRYFPDVRGVTSRFMFTRDKKMIRKINKALRRRNAKRWAQFDKIIPDEGSGQALPGDPCFCGLCTTVIPVCTVPSEL